MNDHRCNYTCCKLGMICFTTGVVKKGVFCAIVDHWSFILLFPFMCVCVCVYRVCTWSFLDIVVNNYLLFFFFFFFKYISSIFIWDYQHSAATCSKQGFSLPGSVVAICDATFINFRKCQFLFLSPSFQFSSLGPLYTHERVKDIPGMHLASWFVSRRRQLLCFALNCVSITDWLSGKEIGHDNFLFAANIEGA